MLLIGLPPANEMELFGEEVRQVAYRDPCFVPTDALDPKFYRLIGLKFHVGAVLELYDSKDEKLPPAPRWHCSVSCLHDIESGDDESFGLPEQAILVPGLWNADDVKDAREIMGYILGPTLLDAHQPIIQIAGMTGYHWLTPADQRYLYGITSKGDH